MGPHRGANPKRPAARWRRAALGAFGLAALLVGAARTGLADDDVVYRAPPPLPPPAPAPAPSVAAAARRLRRGAADAGAEASVASVAEVRGRVTRLQPGDAVTVRLPDGGSETVAWADVRRISLVPRDDGGAAGARP
jgi:hypothetical protein